MEREYQTTHYTHINSPTQSDLKPLQLLDDGSTVRWKNVQNDVTCKERGGELLDHLHKGTKYM